MFFVISLSLFFVRLWKGDRVMILLTNKKKGKPNTCMPFLQRRLRVPLFVGVRHHNLWDWIGIKIPGYPAKSLCNNYLDLFLSDGECVQSSVRLGVVVPPIYADLLLSVPKRQAAKNSVILYDVRTRWWWRRSRRGDSCVDDIYLHGGSCDVLGLWSVFLRIDGQKMTDLCLHQERRGGDFVRGIRSRLCITMCICDRDQVCKVANLYGVQ